VGYVFQGNNLIDGLTAFENVELPLLLLGMDAGPRRKRVMEILDSVGLEDRAGSLPLDLSGGEQQRVAIARAMVHGPSLLLADEPTANLDSRTAHGIFLLIRELNGSLGTTVLFATHDPMLIKQASRIVHIHDGALVI
jgi:putative ABC transport system ATP-binding protein